MYQGRPTPRAGGLPANPRAGARPPPSSRKPPSTEKLSGPSRSIRPQKSMGALPSARERPPLPPAPSRRRSASRPRHTPAGSMPPSSASSISSASSSASFFDRIKTQTGYASSRTSFEDDDVDVQRSKYGAETRRLDLHEDDDPTPSSGEGSTIWSRVAAAAGSLTINVSRTWAVNIATYTGEVTPPGQESRLTRSMKAYHLAKARDPSDLPAWLFDPHERGSFKDQRDVVEESSKSSRAGPSKSQGLRDMFDTAASQQPRALRAVQSADIRPSKAADRLQAMRDAKRGIIRNVDVNVDAGYPSRPSQRSAGLVDVRNGVERRSPPRVGLPSRPTRKS